jgi:transcriptional regulator with XRE-family HTH domain
LEDPFYIMLTSDQIRAGRALVRWSARELAEKAKLSLPTVQRLEAAQGVPSASVKTLISIKEALESAGVEFTNGDLPGVRLRRGR